MRKVLKSLPVLVLFLAAFILTSQPGATYAASVSNYDSGFQIQNLTSDSASIVIEYYNPDGTINQSVSDTVPGNDRVGYYPLPVTAGFTGSVVISSDKPIAAIANVLAEGATLRSSYSGFTAGANKLSLPVVMKDNFGIDTWFSVQNAGSSATTVTVTYAGTACTENKTIQPGAAAIFDQRTNTCLPSTKYVNAATITTGNASDEIVATVLQTTPSFGLYAYNAFPGTGPTNPVFPVILANNFGLQSAAQIQNQGTQATQVTVSYTPSIAGTACTETRTIEPSQSSTFTLFAFTFSNNPTSSTCSFGSRFIGSARVTANSTNQPLVGIVNQTDYAAKGSSYGSLSPANATSSVVFPQIIDAFGFFSGYSVMNVGSGSTTVTCAYSGVSSSFNVVDTLAVGEPLTEVVLNDGLPPNTSGGYNGSVTCTASSGGLIVGVNNVNSSASGDVFTTYEGTNK